MKRIIFLIALLLTVATTQSRAAVDPYWIAKQYIQAHPEVIAELTPNVASNTVITQQFNLLNASVVLTIIRVNEIDSLAFTTPVFTAVNNPGPGYFDASFYNNTPDSVLATCYFTDATGQDSVLAIRLGAFDANNKAFVMDTLPTNKNSGIQSNLLTHALKNLSTYPYWSYKFYGVNVNQTTGASGYVYIFNYYTNFLK